MQEATSAFASLKLDDVYKSPEQQDSRVVFNEKTKQFVHYNKETGKRIEIFKGIYPILERVFWSNYDYKIACQPIRNLLKMISDDDKNKKNVDPSEENEEFDPYAGLTGKQLGVIIHNQVDKLIKANPKKTPAKLATETFIHPTVKAIFVALGKMGVIPISSEETVYDKNLKIATKIDIIGKRRLYQGNDKNVSLVLIEVKTGYSGGSWLCSNGSMLPEDIFRGLLDNSPYHQAVLQLLFSYHLFLNNIQRDKLNIPIELFVIHAFETRAEISNINDKLVKLENLFFEYLKRQAQENPSFVFGTKPKKIATTTDNVKKEKEKNYR